MPQVWWRLCRNKCTIGAEVDVSPKGAVVDCGQTGVVDTKGTEPRDVLPLCW
jgi:hypothetical protein